MATEAIPGDEAFRQLVDALGHRAGFVPDSVRVELEETPGHAALFTWQSEPRP